MSAREHPWTTTRSIELTQALRRAPRLRETRYVSYRYSADDAGSSAARIKPEEV
jgi:hypothetical protein